MGVDVAEVMVKIGSGDIEISLGASVGNVEVKLFLWDESSAVIELTEVYDEKNSCIRTDITDGLEPGDKVEVSMGEPGDKSMVFSGYLDEIMLKGSGEDAYVLQLKARDVIHLLKENVRYRIFTETRISDIFTSVMEEYSWICSMDVKDTQALGEVRIWQQESSDYDFIVKDLIEHGKEDREFYVSCGKAYFAKTEETPDAVTLSDTDCTKAEASLRYVNQTMEVQGYSGTYERFTGTALAAGAQMDDSASAGIRMYLLSEADTLDQADAIAARRAKKLMNQEKTVRMTMKGRQQLLTGVYVKVEAIDDIWNGTYRVGEAIHRYDENGYQTEVLLEGY